MYKAKLGYNKKLYQQRDVLNKAGQIQSSLPNLELEVGKVPFDGESKLELETSKVLERPQIEIDKTGIICVFYICLLPFIRC